MTETPVEVQEFDEDEFIDECNERSASIRALLDDTKYSAQKKALTQLEEFETWLEDQYLDCGAETKSLAKKLLKEVRQEKETLASSLRKPTLTGLKSPQNPDPEAAPETTPETTSSSETPKVTSKSTKTEVPEKSAEEISPAPRKRMSI